MTLMLEGEDYSPHGLVIDNLNQPQSSSQLFFGNIINALEEENSTLPGLLPITDGVGGCIRNVVLGSSGDVNLADGIFSSYPAMPGCPREEHCFPSPCENEGICLSSWEGYMCDCGLDYAGQNCAEGTEFCWCTNTYSCMKHGVLFIIQCSCIVHISVSHINDTNQD